jgi:integrase
MAKLKTTKTPGLYFDSQKRRYLLDKVIKGEHHCKSFPPEITYREALEYIDRLKAAAREAEYFPERTQQRSLKITVLEALNTYWEERLKYKKSAASAKPLFNALDRLLGSMMIQELSPSAIEVYKRKRLAERRIILYGKMSGERKVRYGGLIGPRTVNMELEILNFSLNWLVKNSKIPKNPIKGYEGAQEMAPAKIVLDEGYVDGPQWEALYSSADADTRPILLCLYETGMRPAEIFAMRWEWIAEAAFDRWLIAPPPSLEKTGAERRIPVSRRLLEALKPLRKESGLIFPSPVGGGERQSIRTAFHTARKRGKLPEKITPYSLRRTRITIWDEIDGDACRYVVGHAPSDVHGKHYRRFTPERLFKLVGLELNQREMFKVLQAGS